MKKKLSDTQKLILNEINHSKLSIAGLLCIIFGINYVKLFVIFISERAFYWTTVVWGIALIVLGILFFKGADKFNKRIKELMDIP